MPLRFKGAGHYDRANGVEHGPNGRRLCRWCRNEVPVGRRTFCADANCIHQWSIRHDQGYAREYIRGRDGGKCALCGLDTYALLRRAHHQRYYFASEEERHRAIIERRAYASAIVELRGRSTLWAMDHIIPVVDGGGECGAENLQTLCIFCHARKTAREARERAARRRASK